jgi:drug/metabolite transporter (DMT)-like permease
MTKWLVPTYPPSEIIFIQAILIVVIVGISMRFDGEALFEIRHWRPHLYRRIRYAIESFAFVNALRFLPLAEVVAISFAGPLFMTLFG